ncbi:hypothetical protein B9Z55_005581 [Caenorhabditis nigoni]|uniref:Secreted protein n=1 Tax=Caenorhabditis nigoni TaxID=1611254 RepID=A0A2G5V1F2_9PELO|nr:hypothetical protein B9Z55_005581 [Caenorhabditis nigoni]
MAVYRFLFLLLNLPSYHASSLCSSIHSKNARHTAKRLLCISFLEYICIPRLLSFFPFSPQSTSSPLLCSVDFFRAAHTFDTHNQ